MKAFRVCIACIFGFVILAASFSSARAADTNPPPRLTVELRDGSRVVGVSAEKYFKFHSALLGEIKLDVKDLRSVECISTNQDKLTGWFARPSDRFSINGIRWQSREAVVFTPYMLDRKSVV